MTVIQTSIRTMPGKRSSRGSTASASINRSSVAADVSRLIGRNLRHTRKQQGYSLEALAQASRVSRAMLGQIETGKSVPTVTLLWRIADALNVPIAELITSAPDGKVPILLERSKSKLLTSSGGGYSARAISSTESNGQVQFVELKIAPGHLEKIGALAATARISLVVSQGNIEITVGENAPLHLKDGDAVLFEGSSAHTIFNSGATESIAYQVTVPVRDVLA